MKRGHGLHYENGPPAKINHPVPQVVPTSAARSLRAGMIKKLIRETDQRPALPDTQADYLQPPRSIYETDELAQPRSVTDATTRHLR